MTTGLVPLSDLLGEDDRMRFGGKALGLAALRRAGFAVPDTWVLPVRAQATAAQVAEVAGHAPRWAVRSSATVEDGHGLSYAGMFRTELDVPAADVPAAIDRVRASVRSRRVTAYRRWARAGARSVGMAVLLQPFRPPVRSGLWLGRGLATGRLEWVDGCGDALVSGAVSPAWEEWSSRGYAGGSHDEVLASGGRAVGAACVAVQRGFGVPADLEFALLASGLVWLQFRPMTVRMGTGMAARALDSAPAHVVRGIAASAGQATGDGVWPRDTGDERWKPGAVLLAEQTDPDWVPLMAEASALVTAAGGMLCHAAIVARELGVPCVTNVGRPALARLAAGSRLAVDGTAGTVAVVGPAAEG